MATVPTDGEIDERNILRDARILAAAREVIEQSGLSGMTRRAIAERARLSRAGVSNFGRTRLSNGDHDSEGYRSRIMRALMDDAIARSDMRMVQIGLADGCLRPDALPDHMRAAVGA